MGFRSAAGLLQLPVRLHGIRLGQPVDVLLETDGWRAIGFVVLCGDDVQRFLPFAAAQVGEEEIAVGSALMLLEDVDFYRDRAESLRALLGAVARSGGREEGPLRDVLLGADGAAATLVVGRGGAEERLDPRAATVDSASRASAA